MADASDMTDDELAVWISLIRVSQLLPQRLDEVLQERGSSLARYEILAVLSQATAGVRMGEVGRYALVSKPRMSHHIAELTADGMVDRHVDPSDSRAFVVTITTRGRRHLRSLVPAHMRQARDLVLDGIDTAELPVVLGVLRQTLTALGDDVNLRP